MKFGKQLRGIVECSYPEWQPNFMSYKDLKKRISSRDGALVDSESTRPESDENANPTPPSAGSAQPTAPADLSKPAALRAALSANAPFFAHLRQEVDKVNDFFLEKQEDFVIEHQQLCARVEHVLTPGAASRAEVNRLRQRLIDFHAQLVILENYSTVNYTGFRKILKKHDKKTGLRLRSTCLRNVTATPFFLSDIARRLLLTTERQIADLDQIRKFRRADSDAAEMPPLPRVHDVPNPALGLITLSMLDHRVAIEADGSDVDAEPEAADKSDASSPQPDESESAPQSGKASAEPPPSESASGTPAEEAEAEVTSTA